jgi:energy-coupling factor transporter ATP-binding protein EcfA2
MSDHPVCPHCGWKFSHQIWYGYEFTCENCHRRIIPIITDENDMRKMQEAYEHEKDFMGHLAEREDKLEKSGVRNIFTPARPVISQELFFGAERRNNLKSLIGHLSTPGQHVLLYGERGVGKSSLANVASHAYHDLRGARIYKKGCDSSTTFKSLIREPLNDMGIDSTIAEYEDTRAGGISAKACTLGIEVGGKRERELAETHEGPAICITPAYTAEVLKDMEGLLVIDEADALDQSTEKKNLSNFIKLLSDYDSQFKLLIVGVAETGDELIERHPSIS